MSAETMEAPPVLLGDENPWNRLRYGTIPAPEGATEGFALFPSDHKADGVEVRAVYVIVLEAMGAAICTPKAQRRDFYLPLSRVASEATLKKKREVYAEKLAAEKRMRRDEA